mgnify:CR=1 FL=1
MGVFVKVGVFVNVGVWVKVGVFVGVWVAVGTGAEPRMMHFPLEIVVVPWELVSLMTPVRQTVFPVFPETLIRILWPNDPT